MRIIKQPYKDLRLQPSWRQILQPHSSISVTCHRMSTTESESTQLNFSPKGTVRWETFVIFKLLNLEAICYMPCRVQSLQSCPTLQPQAPLFMEFFRHEYLGFFRHEYWHVLPFPPPRGLPDPGIKPASPALQADSLQLSHQGSPNLSHSNRYQIQGLIFVHLYNFI